ncbi:MAG: hypothetical protein NVSMB12_18500 [Acidimicrobiales bacterium]
MSRAARTEKVSEAPMERRALRGREGIDQARGRFGGLDSGATLAGAFAALGITVLLGGIFAGAGRVVYVNGLRDAPTATTGSIIAGIAVIVVAFLAGGWVAGRMARYDGGRNGMVTAVWFILFAAATSALGTLLGESYNVFAGQHLPQWFTSSAQTPAAVASAAIALLLMLAAGYVGGLAGDRYHRRIDRLIAGLTPVDMPAERDPDRVAATPAPTRRRRWRHRADPVVSGPARGDVAGTGSGREEGLAGAAGAGQETNVDAEAT